MVFSILGRVCKFFLGPAAVLAVALFAPKYSPSEITELQAVPLILQGGTDWGGSNIFVAEILSYFIFGAIGCFQVTAMFLHSEKGVLSSISYLADRFFFAGLLVVFVGYHGVAFCGMIAGYPWSHNRKWSYFFCEFSTVFMIFCAAYGLSFAWILSLRRLGPRSGVRLALAPTVLIFLVWLGFTGMTPKAGQIVNSYEVPRPVAQSVRHRVFISLHSFCFTCLFGERFEGGGPRPSVAADGGSSQ